jgi:hypothetical protein
MKRKEDLSDHVAKGIAKYQFDQAIGALFLLGLIAFPLFPQSALIGIPLLLLCLLIRAYA